MSASVRIVACERQQSSATVVLEMHYNRCRFEVMVETKTQGSVADVCRAVKLRSSRGSTRSLANPRPRPPALPRRRVFLLRLNRTPEPLISISGVPALPNSKSIAEQPLISRQLARLVDQGFRNTARQPQLRSTNASTGEEGGGVHRQEKGVDPGTPKFVCRWQMQAMRRDMKTTLKSKAL
jgi:hypothetical protein